MMYEFYLSYARVRTTHTCENLIVNLEAARVRVGSRRAVSRVSRGRQAGGRGRARDTRGQRGVVTQTETRSQLETYRLYYPLI